MIENIPKKSMLTFAIYLILFAGIVLFLLTPTLKEINQNKTNIIDQRQQLSANYNEIASLQKIEKDSTGFEQIKNTVFGYLPATLDSSEFIVEVEGLAKKTDITIDSVTMSATSSAMDKPKETTPTSTDATDKSTPTSTKKANHGTQKNDFLLDTKADFPKSMAFVQQLEKLSRFNSISAISITPTDTGVDIKLTGDIYYEQ